MHNRHMPTFPSLNQDKLMKLLRSLGYEMEKGGQSAGSHRRLLAEGRPPVTWAFHKGVEVPGRLVRKILVKDVGLSVEEAEVLVGMRRSK